MGDCVIRVSGNVAAAPQIRHTPGGVTVATLRVAWSERWVDRQTGEWRTGPSSFLTVSCWRRLAENVMNTLAVGDPVLVEGRLSLRSYRTSEGEERTRWEIDASRVGPDLNRISGQLHRARRSGTDAAAEVETSTSVVAEASAGSGGQPLGDPAEDAGDSAFPLDEPGEPDEDAETDAEPAAGPGAISGTARSDSGEVAAVPVTEPSAA